MVVCCILDVLGSSSLMCPFLTSSGTWKKECNSGVCFSGRCSSIYHHKLTSFQHVPSQACLLVIICSRLLSSTFQHRREQHSSAFTLRPAGCFALVWDVQEVGVNVFSECGFDLTYRYRREAGGGCCESEWCSLTQPVEGPRFCPCCQADASSSHTSSSPMKHACDGKEEPRVQYIKHTYLLNLYRIEQIKFQIHISEKSLQNVFEKQNKDCLFIHHFILMKADMGCKNKAVCLAQTRFLHHFFSQLFPSTVQRGRFSATPEN